MAIYGYSVSIGSRGGGKNAVAAAAYRAGAELVDHNTGEVKDYSRKGHVEYSEIMLPADAPERFSDRETLWSEVEAVEKRKDSQLYREVTLTLPRELGHEERVELTRSFVKSMFVREGMCADVAIHNPPASDGGEQPHAHVMLTMREVGPDGFGKKNRDWNAKNELERCRDQWSCSVNWRLEEIGSKARVDHRSLAEQNAEAERLFQMAAKRGKDQTMERWKQREIETDRQPQPKLGPIAKAMEDQGKRSHAGDDIRRVKAENAAHIAERKSLWQEIKETGMAWRETAARIRDRAQTAFHQTVDAAEAMMRGQYQQQALAGAEQLMARQLAQEKAEREAQARAEAEKRQRTRSRSGGVSRGGRSRSRDPGRDHEQDHEHEP